MEARERRIQYYLPLAGPPAPFAVWLNGIADIRVKAAITARIARMRGGNFGDSKFVGEGASENKVDFGPGYRIYFATDGEDVVLLHGGDKSSQSADIRVAIGRWRDYKERKNAQERKLPRRSPRRSKK